MPTFISDYRACYDEVIDRFSGSKPGLLSRIGGSDTRALVDLMRVRAEGWAGMDAHVAEFLPLVSRYNGYYDKSKSRQMYFKFCDELLENYRRLNWACLCNFELLSIFFKSSINEQFYKEDIENKEYFRSLIDEVAVAPSGRRFLPYNFIEKIIFDDYTLFRAFQKILPGKTVMVVSPFSESFSTNFGNRHRFFSKNYRYPEFSVKFVTTPITYSGLPEELYPHNNWFETCAALKAEIEAQDFDIALLSCGTYAMPLGEFIYERLGRQAIYVGGVLQLFFGVMGRRYDNPFFLHQFNKDAFIYPVEREKFAALIPTNDKAAREAFGAYF